MRRPAQNRLAAVVVQAFVVCEHERVAVPGIKPVAWHWPLVRLAGLCMLYPARVDSAAAALRERSNPLPNGFTAKLWMRYIGLNTNNRTTSKTCRNWWLEKWHMPPHVRVKPKIQKHQNGAPAVPSRLAPYPQITFKTDSHPGETY